MRLATIATDQGERAAVLLANGSFATVESLVAGGPRDMLGVIAGGDALRTRLAAAARDARGGVPAATARFLAPIPRPRRNVMCVGWNYSEHFAEGKAFRGADDPASVPEWPAFFTKNPRTVTGHDAPVWHPAPHSEQLDWEVELAVIIGTGGMDIAEEDALRHVFGYTIGNDVSVRDVQQKRHGGQWWKGKNFDTHCPLGPWIVTADEIGDVQQLGITSRVNGVTKQDSSTKHMVFGVPRLIHDLSLGAALEPGDIVMTGTPSGVGFARTPPEWLRVGDVIEMEIEKIGVLRNRVQPRATA